MKLTLIKLNTTAVQVQQMTEHVRPAGSKMALYNIKTASLLSTFASTARTPECTLWFGRRHRHK